MPKDPSVTLLEIVNHSLRNHPDFLLDICNLNPSSFSGVLSREMVEWERVGYSTPAPVRVKNAVLLRHSLSDAVWIETGTLHGDTSDFLSRHASHVHTIEPHPELFSNALIRFASHKNVTIYNEMSETFLARFLPSVSGNVCFWLDGHYSSEGTFKGPNDTPLLEELQAIKSNFGRFERVAILIDDIRLCGKRHVYGVYPTLSSLVAFADELNLSWCIEHDIFIASN